MAWAQLGALKSNLPVSVEEKHVAEFHTILKLLFEATAEDTSVFRIPEEDVKPRLISVVRASFRAPGRSTYSDKKFCDRNLFLRRIEAVYTYFNGIQGPAGKPKYGF